MKIEQDLVKIIPKEHWILFRIGSFCTGARCAWPGPRNANVRFESASLERIQLSLFA